MDMYFEKFAKFESNAKITLAVRALAIFGLASLLALGIAGILRLGGSLGSPLQLLASLFTFSREAISVSASPVEFASGRTTTLGWTHGGASRPGSYEFSYPCQDELQLTTLAGDAIPCGASVDLGAVQSFSVVAISRRTSPITSSFSISFLPSGSNTTSLTGSVAVLVTPALPLPPPPPPPLGKSSGPRPPPSAKKPTLSLVPKPGPSKTIVKSIPGTSAILPHGTPDLAIRIVDIGRLDDVTGAFTATSSFRWDDQSGVIFDITNSGTAVSKPWDFTANLPIPSGFYHSDTQPALTPGDRVRFTIGFKHLNRVGDNTAVFTIDPENSLRDANHSNDVATATIVRIN